MPIKTTKFVSEHTPVKKSPKPDVVKGDSEYINLTKDGMLKLKRSQYIEDMVNESKPNANT